MADTRNLPAHQTIMRSVTGLGAPLPGPDAPQLLDVFRDELGLKLVKDRATINDYIIERVEPLIENRSRCTLDLPVPHMWRPR
jgi:hypothetical protein